MLSGLASCPDGEVHAARCASRRVLVLISEPHTAKTWARFLTELGYRPVLARDHSEAVQSQGSVPFGAALIQTERHEREAADLIRCLQRTDPDLQVFAALPDLRHQIEETWTWEIGCCGALDLALPPGPIDAFRIANALDHYSLLRENAILWRRLEAKA